MTPCRDATASLIFHWLNPYIEPMEFGVSQMNSRFLPTGPHEFLVRKVAEVKAAMLQYDDPDRWVYNVVGPKNGPYKIEVRDTTGKVRGYW